MTPEARLKRLRLRCWRRGTKEADLILGRFADDKAARLSDRHLAGLEALLDENDWDIFAWVAGGTAPPEAHRGIVDELRLFHQVF
ncbi:MAG: succinate dehydrogenase assembly factor 2 [Pseudomonadota bacterium]